MKNLLSRVGALALALILPCAAVAQAPLGKLIQAPSGYLSAEAIYCDDGTGRAALCNFGGNGGSVTSRISYTATASGTGYSTGDQLDRIVTTSPTTNTVNAYWVNVTAGGLLTGAPAAANITLKPETLTNTVFGATQSGAWNVGVNNFPTSFQVSNFPTSFAVSNLPGTQPVTQADTYQAGTIASATASAAYTMPIANGYGTGGVVITGLTASGAILTPEGSFDGTNFVPVQVVQAGTKVMVSTISADGQFRFNASGRRAFRFRVTTTGTGIINATSTLSVAGFDAPAPALDSLGNATVNLAAGSGIDIVIKAASYDRGAIVGTTAITLAPINATRRGWAVQVQGDPTSTVACWFNGTVAATADYHRLQVSAGGYWQTPDGHVGIGAISAICNAANVSVYAREW